MLDVSSHPAVQGASGALARLGVLLVLNAVALLVVAPAAESQTPIVGGYGEAPGIVMPPPSDPSGPGSTTGSGSTARTTGSGSTARTIGSGSTATNPPARPPDTRTASAVGAAPDHGRLGSGNPTIDLAAARELRAGPAGVSATLPFTGADLGLMALCALALLLSGTALRRATRLAKN